MNRNSNIAPLLGSVALAAALSVPSTAMAQGYSTDIEIVRPVFSHQGLPGIDTPVMSAQPTMRVGLLARVPKLLLIQ